MFSAAIIIFLTNFDCSSQMRVLALRPGSNVESHMHVKCDV